MDEHEPQKRLDLNDESGVTRREVLRRGAIVGGTLLWVAPAIQSISQKAFAASGGKCAACYCYTYKNHPAAKDIEVNTDKGKTEDKTILSSTDCDAYCASLPLEFDDTNTFLPLHVKYCEGSTTSGCFTKKHEGERFDYDPGEAGAVADLLKVAIGCD